MFIVYWQSLIHLDQIKIVLWHHWRLMSQEEYNILLSHSGFLIWHCAEYIMYISDHVRLVSNPTLHKQKHDIERYYQFLHFLPLALFDKWVLVQVAQEYTTQIRRRTNTPPPNPSLIFPWWKEIETSKGSQFGFDNVDKLTNSAKNHGFEWKAF